MSSDAQVTHLVLTGGPCAGKTSALAHLRQGLTERGWRVLLAPEAATLLVQCGVVDIPELARADRGRYLAVQAELVRLQLGLRERMHTLATELGHRRTVVLHDRGVADNAAYMNPVEYTAVLAEAGLSFGSVHALYDAVLYLRSAAVPGPGYDGSGYTVANNVARTEGAREAAQLDGRTLTGWAHHPHLFVVPAGDDFGAKLDRVLASALTVLGDPEPVEVETKWLLEHEPDLAHPVLAGAAVVQLEQVYLPCTGAGEEQRVRARTVDGATTYTHTVKREVGDGSRVELETAVSAETYRLLARMQDPATATVRKTRRIFVHGDQRFELDEVHEPVRAWLLEAELVAADDPVTVPDFLGGARDVTHEPAWRNRALAAGGRPQP